MTDQNSIFQWDVLCELDVTGQDSLLTVEEMLHRHTKILDVYEGDLDLGNFIKYMLVVCTGRLAKGEDLKGSTRFYSGLESRMIVRFAVPNLKYPPSMTFRYIIPYGAFSDRTTSHFKVTIKKTNTRCKELSEVITRFLGTSLNDIHHHYYTNYPPSLKILSSNLWVFHP